MPQTAEFLSMIAPEGGRQRAKVLSPAKRKRIAKKAARARWKGLNAAERKIERAKGRASKSEKEPTANRKG